MIQPKRLLLGLRGYAVAGLLTTVCMLPAHRAVSQAPSRQLGTIQSISGDQISLTTDSAKQVLVHIAPDAKIVKLPAGSKDMKDAQPLGMKDVAVGDRVLVRGTPGEDSGSFVASSVIVMKGDDIQQKRQQQQEEWQKHGTGGMVSSVDPAASAISISSGRAGQTRTIVHVSPATVIRSYAPDSVKFEDAQLSTLAQVKPGDQLRARGARTATGDVDAEEIVSGSFRNIAGSIVKLDPAAGVLTIKDAATQKPVEIKISADSQLRRLPAMAAQMMARRASTGEAVADAPASGPAATNASPADSRPAGGMHGTTPSREAPDLQQIVGKLPKMSIDELHPGDVVMIVATPGNSNRDGTVITLLAGVEAILAATPKGGQVMTLSPWNINGSPGEASQ